MDPDQITKTMDFLAASGDKVLGILGGEPTLHPNFIEIIQQALKRGFFLKVFSNCIMDNEKVEFLASLPAKSMSIICNISDYFKDSPKNQAKRIHSLEVLGSRITLGITVSSIDFEYDYLLDFITKYHLNKRLRVGIAQPIVGQENVYFPPEQYPEIGTSMVKMANDLIKHDILIGFDCGLTLCMFTEAQLGAIMTKTEGFKAVCHPIIDIGPDLETWSCFPLSEVYRSTLDQFPNNSALINFYKGAFAPYRSIGCRPECLHCDYMRRGQCHGGCVAHAINAMNRKPPAFVAEEMLKATIRQPPIKG